MLTPFPNTQTYDLNPFTLSPSLLTLFYPGGGGDCEGLGSVWECPVITYHVCQGGGEGCQTSDVFTTPILFRF